MQVTTFLFVLYGEFRWVAGPEDVASGPRLYRILSGVPKWWIANIVSQARRGDNRRNVWTVAGQMPFTGQQPLELSAKRPANARNFDAVCQPRARKVVFGKRKYLCLVL